MIKAARVLVWSALTLAVALPAAAQPPSASPPVLSTQASPPAGASSEPAQMSGYALQVGDLPPGIVAVRVIRESFQTNVPDETVLLRVGDSNRVLSATTNAEGRVQFDGLKVGTSVRVRATVGSEVLESQPFDIPAQGGVRMVLVAGVGANVASPADKWPPATATSSSVPIAPPPTPMAPPPAAAPVTAAPVSAGQTTTGVNRTGLLAVLGVLAVIAGVLLKRRRSNGATRASHGARVERPGHAGPATVATASMTLRERRAAVFEDLVRLEKTSRVGRAQEAAYSKRREALIGELVALDASLDESSASPPR